MILRFRALPILVMLASCPSLAFGQTEQEASAAEEETNAAAKKLMAEGNALYKSRSFDEAHEKFLEAWSVKQHSAIASNLVETEMKLARFAEAANRLRALLATMPVDDKEERTAFMMQLSECRHHLFALHVTVNVDGATVKVGNKEVGKSPLDSELLVEPGQAKVVVELAGYEPATVITPAGAAGESKNITIDLVKKAPLKPVAPTKPLGTTKNIMSPESASLQPRTFVLIAGTTLAVAGATLGVVYLRMRSNTEADSLDLRREVTPGGCIPGQVTDVDKCATLHETNLRFNRQTNIMVGSFIGGGIAAVATVATYFLWPTKPADSTRPEPVKTSLVPWSSPGGAGLQVVGTF